MNNGNEATLVIVAYKPKPGQDYVLRQLVEKHVPLLASLGLVMDRKPVIAACADGTIIEVFEWLSVDAIQKAHGLPEIHQMWTAFGEACDYVPLNALPETSQLFAGFIPLA